MFKKLIFSHPQAYKLEDKTIIMKEYNGVFVVQFTVQELANKLLESYLGEMPMPLIEEVQAVASGQSDFNVSEGVANACIAYMMDYQHYERLVESIVDCVENSQDSCATIFNALNGWVKFDVPGLKKIPRQEAIFAEEIAEYTITELNQQIEETKAYLDTNIDSETFKEFTEWLQLLTLERESKQVQLDDKKILAEEIAGVTNDELNRRIEITRRDIYSLEKDGFNIRM